jgi:hypothetical protein
MRALLATMATLLVLPGVAAAQDPVSGPFPQKTGEMLTSVPTTPSCGTSATEGTTCGAG